MIRGGCGGRVLKAVMNYGLAKFKIFANGAVFLLDDFKTLSVHANGKKKENKLFVQDKA